MTTTLPPQEALMKPTLEAISHLGGSGSINEIADTVALLRGFSETQLSLLHLDGPQTEIRYRLAWARTYLKGMGLLDNSSRGIWALTDEASRFLTDTDVDTRQRRLDSLVSEYQARRRRNPVGAAKPEAGGAGTVQGEDAPWREQLLSVLLQMDPAAFERLAQRLLREADVDGVTVTGRSGDGGLDGIGVYRLGLVGFPVFFQCKRYRGSVGSGAVRDFRGAMSGRGDKGLLITTGTFTMDAKREARRDGAPPVDLIDGAALCDLLKKYELGVRTEMVESVEVRGDFFREI